MGFGIWLDFPEYRRSALLERIGEIPAKYIENNAHHARQISASHLAGFPPDSSKFQKIAGLLSWRDTGIRIMIIEAADWGNAYQSHKRQAGQAPTSVLEGWEGLVTYKHADIQERLYARAFRAADSAAVTA